MSKLKNRIITISGEPASGKSTVIKELKKYYEEQGFIVHISTIGHEFRRIAEERGMSIKELNKYMQQRAGIDEYIDSQVAKQGREINEEERPNEIFIFDSRLAFHTIPDSMSVRLTADSNVAGKRVFHDKKRGKEDQYETLEEAIKATEERKQSEVQRYKDRYGIDLQNTDNYDLVIDTSYSKVEDIAEVIQKCLEYEMKQKFYAKMWTSPKKLLPLQSERDTMGYGSYYSIDQMKDIISTQGYLPDADIDTVEVNGKLYIVEGHHRNFASVMIGKTLVPYFVLGKDNEKMIGRQMTAKDFARGCSEGFLFGHEWIFENDGEHFSYNDIYPGIYEEIKRKDEPSTPPQGDGR